MTLNSRAFLLAIGVSLAGCAATASAQTAKMPSVYQMVDVGPVPVPGPCSCIGAPFVVSFRPDPRYPSGPGAPAERATTAADRQRAEVRAEDRASVSRRAEQGLAGDANASLSIAMDLDFGAAFAGDPARTDEEVVRWLHLAASQGQSNAFRFLAYSYSHGRGVAQNDSAAAYWFHRAATDGDHVSMMAVGLLFAAGRGVPQDWGAAVHWLERARGGNPMASRFLGDAYACGLGVAPDPERAAALYKAAADRGESSSSTQLGHMYAKGCAEGSDEAAKKAYQAAADQGDPEAQVELSELVRQGRGEHPNPYSAYTWARLAELRLAPGELKTRATAAVKAAVRQMLPEALPAQEALVQSLFAWGSRPMR
jgi:TPR repeat protein